jgi:hypothetical protein
MAPKKTTQSRQTTAQHAAARKASASKTPQLVELGKSGLTQYGGYVFEEFLPKLTGRNWIYAVREMTSNDAVINSVLFVIEMFAKQTTWDVVAASEDAADKQEAEIMRGVLFDDMSMTWADMLSEILTMLPWGWSYFETVFKRRSGESSDPAANSKFNDGRIGLRKLAIRAQESLVRWEFDDNGGIQGMYQSAAPDYVMRFIPIEKALLFRTTAHKGNPEGRSIIRGAYRSWYFKNRIENIEGVGIERDLAGLPWGKLPSDYMDPAADDDKKAVYENFKNIITGVKRDEQEGLVTPSDRDANGNLYFEVSLLSTGGQRQFDTDKIITRYDQRIAICALADFILLGHTQKAGSYGMTRTKGEMFTTALSAWLDSTCDVFNRHLIPRLQRLNGKPTDKLPKLVHGEVEKVDLTELAAYISALSGAGITFTPEEQQYLKEQAKLPVTQDDTQLEDDTAGGQSDGADNGQDNGQDQPIGE